MSETAAAVKPAFPYKTQPMPHQREALMRSVREPFFALFMEMGTGKTYVTVITAAYLYMKGLIDAMVIVAPKGVHESWVYDQIPEHLPEEIPWKAHVWESSDTRAYYNKMVDAGLGTRGRWTEGWDVSVLARDMSVMTVLAINTDAIRLPLGEKAVGTFLTRRRCLFVIDEIGSGFAKPSGKGARMIMRWRDRAPYRRVLEGVPAQDPFELYVPMRFLSPRILGYNRYKDFQEAHAEWDEFERGDNGRKFKVIRKRDGKKVFKDLDKLHAKVARYSYRCRKVDVLPDLPPKIYHKRYFHMSEEQWRLTLELLNEWRTSFADGRTVTVHEKLTQYLRWQQIASGYVPTDRSYDAEENAEPLKVIDGPNPRLELAVEELLRHSGQQQIVWTRFHFDIDLLRPRLSDEGFRVGVYDGRVSSEDKLRVRQRFEAGEIDVFLSNTRAGGVGLNELKNAEHMLYYVNYFGLRKRLQSEDRANRKGSLHSVNITDLIGIKSIDTIVVKSLRNSMEVADAITGDPTKDWI